MPGMRVSSSPSWVRKDAHWPRSVDGCPIFIGSHEWPFQPSVPVSGSWKRPPSAVPTRDIEPALHDERAGTLFLPHSGPKDPILKSPQTFSRVEPTLMRPVHLFLPGDGWSWFTLGTFGLANQALRHGGGSSAPSTYRQRLAGPGPPQSRGQAPGLPHPGLPALFSWVL